jgi:HSP20 family molecular chaperone IbpA
MSLITDKEFDNLFNCLFSPWKVIPGTKISTDLLNETIVYLGNDTTSFSRYLYKYEIRGFEASELDISIIPDDKDEFLELVIEGSRTDENSSFSVTKRTTLPGGIDPKKVSSQLKDGILSISVPKRVQKVPMSVVMKKE